MAITEEMVMKSLKRSLSRDWEQTIGDMEALIAGEYRCLKTGDLTANYAIELANGWRRDANCIRAYSAFTPLPGDGNMELFTFANKLIAWADDFAAWSRKVMAVSTRD